MISASIFLWYKDDGMAVNRTENSSLQSEGIYAIKELSAQEFLITQFEVVLMSALSFRHIYHHDMVFQQGQPIAVAGYGTDGDTVTVTMGDHTATTVVTNGVWNTELPPMTASYTAYTLVASTLTERVELTGILIGEVWIMTGQSNPAYQIDQITDLSLRQAVIDYVQDDMVRSVTTCHGESPNEHGDLAKPAVWHKGTGEIMREGAIGIALAKFLRDTLDVPVGVVTAAWGGSMIAQWIGDGVSNFVYANTAKCWTGLRYAAFVWYQGESDQPANLNRDYAARFAKLRDMFRTDFAVPDIEMFVMQLPNHDVADPNKEYGWVAIRRTQEALMDTFDRLYTVCTIDMGEADNIHPNDKLRFAKRLALPVMRYHYGDERFPGISPRAKTVEATDTGWTVTFDMEGALTLTEGDTVCGLELKAADGTRTVTTGRIIGDRVIAVDRVAGTDAKEMLYLQYNHNPSVNLFSTNGLPAFPFAFSL